MDCQAEKSGETRMKNPVLYGMAMLSMVILGAGCKSARKLNPISPKEQKSEWKLLFDGKTMNGWRTYQKPDIHDGWKAVDGVLTRVGGGGDIVTTEEYANFDLVLEWRVEEGGNSGIMYRVAETEKKPYLTGVEMQVLDDARHRDGKNPLTSSGSCYALYAPTKVVVNPAGQWNKARLVARGPKVEHWLNGVKIVSYEVGSADWEAKVAESKFSKWTKFAKPTTGVICLQDHGDKVEYRNIKIRVLD